MIKVTLINRQKCLNVTLRPLKRLVLWLANQNQRRAHAFKGHVVIVLTDDEGIREVNCRTFLRDTTTDVITLTYRPCPMASQPSAEIFVNVECAYRVARGRLPKARRELALYLAHGLDHLFGARDHTPAQRATMLRREQKWVREAEQKGFLNRHLATGVH